MSGIHLRDRIRPAGLPALVLKVNHAQRRHPQQNGIGVIVPGNRLGMHSFKSNLDLVRLLEELVPKSRDTLFVWEKDIIIKAQ